LHNKLVSQQFRQMPLVISGYQEAAMAWVPVSSYYLRYNTADKQPIVGIYYREGSANEGKLLGQHFLVSAEDALFLGDMLRNEGPVYYEIETGALASGKEKIGEGEGLSAM
jgi:hypothetical protein